MQGGKGEMRPIERATTPEAIGRALADLGLAPLPPTGPGRIPARQLALPLDLWQGLAFPSEAGLGVAGQAQTRAAAETQNPEGTRRPDAIG